MDDPTEASPSGTAHVQEYMTREVATVAPGDTVAAVARRIVESDGHNGFPVTTGRAVEGFVTARDLLDAADDEPIRGVMSTELVVAHPGMDVNEAARVLLRSGIQTLPVVDDAGRLVGIISNADVIRSQIERATPEKVEKLVRTLETVHGASATEERRAVAIDDLVPTQPEVYADELEGRRYELENGLAEPLVVVASGEQLLLADGHHRAMAARRAGIAEMDAVVIALDADVELGLARTAREAGLTSVADIEVVDYARHPLVETTERFQ